MLVTLSEILQSTRKEHYAVGLFNCVTLEMVLGIIAAAEREHSPVIIGPAESLLGPAALPDFADMMLGAAKRAKVPVAVHFDHGFSPEYVRQAIALGFSSVMYDCSMLPFAQNVENVHEMVAAAHKAHCSLEAEIGHVGSNGSAEEGIAKTVYTQPEEAVAYATQSGCDALAVAIGTAHGVYIEKPTLNLDVLSAIASATQIPLVLHGGSGLSDDDFRAVVARGISKINIFTHNNLTAARAANASFTDKTGAFELMPSVVDAVAKETAHLMHVFGSVNKA